MNAERIMSKNGVTDEEVLYRAVRNDPRLLAMDADGRPHISSTAFNDPGRRPSVDRAALCPGGAAETRDRFSPGSGVLALVAHEVRGVTITHGGTSVTYGVDVEPVPLPDNRSHAEIFGHPPFDTDKVFDRIKQALARIATVVLEPDANGSSADQLTPL